MAAAPACGAGARSWKGWAKVGPTLGQQLGPMEKAGTSFSPTFYNCSHQ